jgi:excisionase family DNA binding protein
MNPLLECAYISVSETRTYLGISRQLVIQMLEDGRLDGCKMGSKPNSHWRITTDSIAKLMEANDDTRKAI